MIALYNLPPKDDSCRCSGERCSRPLPPWNRSWHRGGLHRLRGKVGCARSALRTGARRVLALRVLPLGANVVQGHLLRPTLFLQELPRGGAVLRVRVPGPSWRGHALPRAIAAPSTHPGWKLFCCPPPTLHPNQNHLSHSCCSREVDIEPTKRYSRRRRRAKPILSILRC